MASVPNVDVASDYDDTPQGPEDQSEGEIIDSEGDPADAGLPILDNLKMSEEEQRDYDAFSLASVSVSKRPWRAQEDLKVSKPQPQDVSVTRQAHPQAVAKAQSVKSEISPASLSPGPACEPGTVSSHGIPRSRSKARPRSTSCGPT